MMKIYKNISKLYTFRGFQKKEGLFPEERDFSPLKNAAIVVKGKKIEWVGKEKDLPRSYEGRVYDLEGLNVFPSFTESHTHLIFAGDRKKEFEQKIQGATYQEIQKSGGGIRSTVKNTKKATKEELKSLAQERLLAFKKQGVGLLELKSGYGQDLKTEIKQLEVAFSLKGLRLEPTYLALHSHPGDKDKYVERVLKKDLPKIKFLFPQLKRADLFVEKGFFDLQDLESFVKELEKLGLSFCAHVDQLSSSGAALKSAALGALSVEHAVHLSRKEIREASQFKTIFNLLPAADFYMDIEYPPARELIDAGVRVSLATDYNPGTSPTKDLSFVGLLARRKMKMTLPEVWCAYTINASRALGHFDKGALLKGFQASFFTTQAEAGDFFYEVGEHPVKKLYC